jgi:hypothetical protein
MKAPLDNLQFDSVIVGGGSAGCVLAHCLSAIPPPRVPDRGQAAAAPVCGMPKGHKIIRRDKT